MFEEINERFVHYEMVNKKISKMLLLLFLISFALVPNSYAGSKPKGEEYVFALAPQNKSTLLFKAWSPVIERYNQNTSSNVQLKFFPAKDEFEQYLQKGEADFVFGSAFYYILANKWHGYAPLVRSDAKVLKGIIVAPKDSGIKLNDLNGQTMVFPSQNALAASLYIRSLLESKGVSVNPVYAGTHENAYYFVLNGLAMSGGGVSRTLSNFEYKDSLKVIYTTPGLPTHPIIAHPRVTGDVKEKLISHFLSLDKTENGKQMLKKIKLSKPVRADHDRDYKILSDLDIMRYSTFGNTSK